MNNFLHHALQAIATAAQVSTVLSDAVPLKYKGLVVALGSLAQWVVSYVASKNGVGAK